MNRFFQRIFLLIVIFLGCSHYSFAMFPPVEIITHLEGYRVSSIRLSCNIQLADTELRDKIKESYSNLYEDVAVVDSLDLRTIRNNYESLLQYTHDSNVIRFRFDLREFVRMFHFDENLLRAAFRNGSIPFAIEYTFNCNMESQKSRDEVIHKIVFSRFFGGNPIISETSSDIFRHIQDIQNPGQMILTDQK